MGLSNTTAAHQFPTYEPSKCKRCRRCGQVKPVGFFSRDRSRRGGRWHTCKLCSKSYWAEHSRPGAVLRKLRKQVERKQRQGLRGLRQYPHRRERFSSLPPELRNVAEELLRKNLYKHRHRMTPQLYAALVANAASNARRVGNHSWSLSMRRNKGYRRAERRRAQREATKQERDTFREGLQAQRQAEERLQGI